MSTQASFKSPCVAELLDVRPASRPPAPPLTLHWGPALANVMTTRIGTESAHKNMIWAIAGPDHVQFQELSVRLRHVLQVISRLIHPVQLIQPVLKFISAGHTFLGDASLRRQLGSG
mgnify:CR=1 FL=1